MSTWLPKGAEAPKTNSNYMKLIEGTIKFRVVSEPIFGWEYWTEENKPVRLHENPQTKPKDVRLEKDGSYNVKHFWAFKVIDREDGMVKIFEITQNGIKRDIESLIKDADWGDPQEYDIKITGTGDGLARRYTVNPIPHKELTAEEKSLVARTEIDLNQLFSGSNPFIVEVKDDEVKLEDVPF
jgi:hypothetical protein